MSDTGKVSPDAFVTRIARDDYAFLRSRLLPDTPQGKLIPTTRGDYDFNPEFKPPPGERNLTPAAVLVPIIARDEPTMLFTQRTEHLSRHAGQVSFPGGRMDEGDESPLATALRETHEETGIAANHVDVAGFMDGYETGTGFAILPVVGILSPNFTLMPNPAEVQHVFEVPLTFLLDPKNRERQTREWRGQAREFYAYTYGPHYIWGATAAILVGLADRLKAP